MKKLLVIEDMKEIREIYLRVLEEYELKFALEKEEIEPLIDEVDLVLCDYHFNPKLSFEKVKEMVGDRRPIVLCSSDPYQVQKYDGVLKPEIMRNLIPRINKELGKRLDFENTL